MLSALDAARVTGGAVRTRRIRSEPEQARRRRTEGVCVEKT